MPSTTKSETIDRLRAELKEARAFAEHACRAYNDMLASRRVTCVYCGHQYEEGTPEAKQAALTAHIAQCEAHPMRRLGQVLCALMDLPFPPAEDDLKAMRLGIAAVGHAASGGEDVRNAINALDALRVFLPTPDQPAAQ